MLGFLLSPIALYTPVNKVHFLNHMRGMLPNQYSEIPISQIGGIVQNQWSFIRPLTEFPVPKRSQRHTVADHVSRPIPSFNGPLSSFDFPLKLLLM